MFSDASHPAHKQLGTAIIALMCAIPIVRWFQLNPAAEAFASSYDFFSMLGQATALIGTVMYAISFVLSTRWRWVEDIFGGLGRVYIAHHIVGGVALVSLLAHPLALALKYIPEDTHRAAMFLLPDTGDSAAIILGFVALLGLVVLVILTLFVKLPYHIWQFTHKFMGLAFLVGGLHIMLIPSDTSSDDFMRWYMLGSIGIGLAAFTYRTLLPRIFVRRSRYTVDGVQQIADGVTQIHLTPQNKAIDYQPGQFIFVRFIQDNVPDEWHPFSISSAPSQDKLTIAVKALGDYTRDDLPQLQPGAPADIEGAFGHFVSARYSQPRQVWIAGGIGITPFISMAKELESNAQKPNEIHMFYSTSKKSEMVGGEVFKSLAGDQGKNFHYHPWVSGKKGSLITAKHIHSIVGDLSNTDIFICGPPVMMADLRSQLLDLGAQKRNIHTEEFAMRTNG